LARAERGDLGLALAEQRDLGLAPAGQDDRESAPAEQDDLGLARAGQGDPGLAQAGQRDRVSRRAADPLPVNWITSWTSLALRPALSPAVALPGLAPAAPQRIFYS
jgi:hypothetical protein